MLAQWSVAVLLVGVLGSVLGVDRTVSPGSNGRVVVDAVVNRISSNCIFGDDRLFLRRIAYVATSDGEDPKTYRNGYHGGIWQIDEAVFDATTDCEYPVNSTCDMIAVAFGIDWRRVRWSELRKPLFSALAATLHIQLNSVTPPANITEQATFWKQHMTTEGNKEHFIAKASHLPETDCRTEMDLVFILDGSGSVSYRDFFIMLGFVQKVVDKLDVADDTVKVAVLEYSSRVGRIIYFKNSATKASLRYAIRHIRKSNSGTNTALAINTTVTRVFTTSGGARPNAKRVAILITDGQSNNKNKTLQAAEAAKAKGIVFTTVGVGNIDRGELHAVASHPDCTHVFLLDNFMEIDSLLYQLKETSCAAPKVISTSSANATDTTVTKPLPANRTVTETYQTRPRTVYRRAGVLGGGGSGSDGSTTADRESVTGNDDSATTNDEGGVTELQTVVTSAVRCGTLEVYASYLTTRPGPAFYDYKDSARDGRPSVLYFNSTVQGNSLYITVVGARLRVSDIALCLNASYSVSVTTQPTTARVACLTGTTERLCTREDFLKSRYRHTMCDDTRDVTAISNPCTTGSISIHPHPSDLTKFIQCSARGKMFVTQCPEPEIYNGNTQSCGHEAVTGGTSSVPLPESMTNQCTPAHLAQGRFYFPYSGETSRFIQCDVWGRAWVKQCPGGLEWDNAHLTCSHPTAATTTTPTMTTTMTGRCANTTSGARFSHPTNPQMFIVCSNGVEIIQTCAGSLVYDASIGVCNWA